MIHKDVKRDKFGKELDLYEWAELFENEKYKRIGLYKRWDGLRVSTIWLGLNHGFGGRDLYFETMVFPPFWVNPFERFKGELSMARYTTLHQAEQGHEKYVDLFRWWPIRRKGIK